MIRIPLLRVRASLIAVFLTTASCTAPSGENPGHGDDAALVDAAIHDGATAIDASVTPDGDGGTSSDGAVDGGGTSPDGPVDGGGTSPNDPVDDGGTSPEPDCVYDDGDGGIQPGRVECVVPDAGSGWPECVTDGETCSLESVCIAVCVCAGGAPPEIECVFDCLSDLFFCAPDQLAHISSCLKVSCDPKGVEMCLATSFC